MGPNLIELVKRQIISARAKAPDKKLVYTVGNTRVLDESDYYQTPVRIFDDFILTGIIVFSEVEAELVFREIDGTVDHLFVDCEKKSKNISDGFFNLERLSTELIQKSPVSYFKGNDITVTAIDDFVFNFFKKDKKLLGGSNILIIGIGNIGFKIALKLVERGANVYLSSRNLVRTKKLIEVINDVKPRETISNVSLFANQDIPFDGVLFTGLGPLNLNESILMNNVKSDTLILDVGKGSVSEKQIQYLNSVDIGTYRLDIGDVLYNKIYTQLHKSKSFKIPSYVTLENGKRVIETGIAGLKGDILVESLEKMNDIIGVCDGKGGLIRVSNG